MLWKAIFWDLIIKFLVTLCQPFFFYSLQNSIFFTVIFPWNSPTAPSNLVFICSDRKWTYLLLESNQHWDLVFLMFTDLGRGVLAPAYTKYKLFVTRIHGLQEIWQKQNSACWSERSKKLDSISSSRIFTESSPTKGGFFYQRKHTNE